MADQFFVVAHVDELKEGEMKRVLSNDLELLLVKVEGGVYAIDNLCPHAWGMLDQGTLHGYEVQCPLHIGRFDVRTGEATQKPAKQPVKTYPVKIEGDMIMVGMQ